MALLSLLQYGKRIDVIKLLFGYGADINAKNELGETPLHKALVGGWEVIDCRKC